MSLDEKIARSLDIIANGISQCDGKVAVSFNGGKDCTVLLDLALKATEPSRCIIPVVYVRPNDPIAELEAFAKDTCLHNERLRLHEYSGLTMKEGLQRFLDETGVTGVLVGLRGNDPHGRTVKALIPTDNGWPSFLRVHPLLDWDYSDVWTYIKRNNIPYCHLYDQGFTSLGEAKNTQRNPALKKPDGSYKPAYELVDPLLERDSRK